MSDIREDFEEAADKIQRLEQQLEMVRPKIAQLTMVLSDAQQIIESDANTPENYGSLCRIGSALPAGDGSAQAWLLRKQAEAVEDMWDKVNPDNPGKSLKDKAQRLRQKADELEQES